MLQQDNIVPNTVKSNKIPTNLRPYPMQAKHFCQQSLTIRILSVNCWVSYLQLPILNISLLDGLYLLLLTTNH